MKHYGTRVVCPQCGGHETVRTRWIYAKPEDPDQLNCEDCKEKTDWTGTYDMVETCYDPETDTETFRKL